MTVKWSRPKRDGSTNGRIFYHRFSFVSQVLSSVWLSYLARNLIFSPKKTIVSNRRLNCHAADLARDSGDESAPAAAAGDGAWPKTSVGD
jgi:hypothetical protein